MDHADDLERVREGALAEPEEIVHALTREGFQEYKREVAKTPHQARPAGGMWQGLDPRTGAVASAIWINQPRAGRALVYVNIDGEPPGAGAAEEGRSRE